MEDRTAVSKVNMAALVPTREDSETDMAVELAATHAEGPWAHLRVVDDDQVLVAHSIPASPLDGVKL
jgi:hypothetical protein